MLWGERSRRSEPHWSGVQRQLWAALHGGFERGHWESVSVAWKAYECFNDGKSIGRASKVQMSVISPGFLSLQPFLGSWGRAARPVTVLGDHSLSDLHSDSLKMQVGFTIDIAWKSYFPRFNDSGTCRGTNTSPANSLLRLNVMTIDTWLLHPSQPPSSDTFC